MFARTHSDKRSRRVTCAGVAIAFALSWGVNERVAGAAPKDEVALKIDRDAMGNDYLDTSFGRAEKKLLHAISLCGKDKCSNQVKAHLHRDLAVVYLGGMEKREEGQSELANALALDPKLTLDPDFATTEIKEAFEAEKRRLTAKQSTASALAHTPITEQRMGVPIPVFATLSKEAEEGGVTRVRVRYRAVGAKKWKAVVMKRHGDGYAAEIPCGEALRKERVAYHIQGLDSNGELLEQAGSASDPFVVTMNKRFEGEPPHWPDSPPPESCEASCKSGSDCDEDEAYEVKRSWLSLTIQQDFGIGGSTNDACASGNQVNGGLSCFRQQGSQYHGNPVPGRNDSVSGGVSVATTRLLFGFDRVLTDHLTAGLRLGYVLRGGGPRPDGADSNSFLPVHGELRVGYWFGDGVFARPGVRPFIHAEIGFAQADTHTTTVVHEDSRKAPSASQLDNPPTQTLDVYRRMGQGFAGAGLGLMLAPRSDLAFLVELRAMQLFPTLGTVIAPNASFALGF